MSQITDGDVKHFVDEGFLVVPGVVHSDQVEAARAEAKKFAAGHYPARGIPADGNILAVHFPHWVSATALDLIHHEGIVDVVSRVAGAHLAHWNGAAKCMQSMLFLKPPGLPGQAWHQDERFIPTRDRSLVGAWIALDEATIENGCLWVLPGSHRSGILHQHRPHGNPDEYDPTDESFGFDDSAAIPVEVNTGDVVFFNGYLLHKSTKNRSTGTRRALVNHYMSAASLLPWSHDGTLDIATTDMRVIVHVSGEEPYPWKGYTVPPTETIVRPASGKWALAGRPAADTNANALG
jgi:phytanoyl-CoA hydroxylase